ncbi:LysR family transcriptional regulator [Arthrobacter crystallopoietes]|uniref:LysR family transcriptional regulator n=1 Tax=Crystallibacter crystallopoietes TaxID=37928 RepID=UPI003D1A6587
MDLKYLQAFSVLAEELHFGRAADRLGVAQPQLSVWIRRLERELGVELFDRSNRAVRLTAAGEAVREPVRRTLLAMQMVKRVALLGESGIVGQVRIGYPGASSRSVLPQLTRAVRTRHPGIDLKLQSQVYGGSAPAQVAAGAIDIGFSRLPVHNKDVNVRIFTYERIVAALPADHRLASAPTVRLQDLAVQPFVSFPATQGSTVRDAVKRLTGEAGFEPRILQEAPDSHAILGLVAAGVGVTLTVSSVQHIQFPGLVYRDLAGEATYLASVVVWPRHNVSRPAQAVLDVMEQIMPTPEKPRGRVLP